MDKCLNLYVGTPDDTWQDRLYLDIVVGNIEIPVENSPEVADMPGEEFVFHLGKLLNVAKLLSRELSLPIRISLDDLLTEGTEEFDESTLKNIRALVREVKGA